MHGIRRHIPNALSLSRFALVPVIVVLAFFPEMRVLELVLITYGVVSDKVDGMLARYWKVESEFGKKVESLSDPLFSIACACYLILRTDFPHWIFWYGLVLFGINTLGRGLVYLLTKKFFYVKSQITRYSTAIIFLNGIVFAYELPGRMICAYIGVAYGMVTMLNYCRLEYIFYREHRRKAL